MSITDSTAVICVGGPALTYYVIPTEEELFKKYNPDLQRKSLANRDKTQAEFNEYVAKLKEYSKSDKPSKSYLLFGQLKWEFSKGKKESEREERRGAVQRRLFSLLTLLNSMGRRGRSSRGGQKGNCQNTGEKVGGRREAEKGSHQEGAWAVHKFGQMKR